MKNVSKIAKSFRLEEDTIKMLDKLVEIHQQLMTESIANVYSVVPSKKLNRTDILELAIRKEYLYATGDKDFTDLKQ